MIVYCFQNVIIYNCCLYISINNEICVLFWNKHVLIYEFIFWAILISKLN